MLVLQCSPLKTLGTHGILYSIPPPHMPTSTTSWNSLRTGWKNPTRRLRPSVRLACAVIGATIAAPATSVNATRRSRLAPRTLIVDAPFNTAVLIGQDSVSYRL